jgi:uncharacterized protein (DUF2345 family)
MAKSWLELQDNLRTGAARLPNPVPNSSCGVSTSQTAQTNILGLPDLTSAAQPVNDFLSNVQGEIDQFGAEVMGVLQDIGAFIPPELQGFGSGSSEQEDGKSKVAAVSNLNHTILANGEVTVSDGSDPDTGDSYYSIVTSSGGAIHLDTDGSVILVAGKNPSTDPKTGRIDLIAQGAGVQKYGEFLAIEVNNDNEALAAENPSIKGAAFSLVVYGNVEIESRGGDVKLGGKNVAITASDSIELTGADIKLLAGAAPTTTGSNKSKEEQGGTIELKAGIIKQSQAGQQNIEGATYNKVDGEKLFQMNNSQGNFAIESSGTLSIKTGGDMIEEIGGRKMTEVFSALPGVSLDGGLLPPKPMILGVSAGYYIVNKFPVLSAPGKDVAELPPLAYFHSPVSAGGHGFKVEASIGNIGIFSKTGSVAIGTDFGAFADITTPFLSPTTPKSVLLLKKPGTYVTSADDLSLGAKITTSLFTGPAPTGTPPVDDSIVITPGFVKINALKGGIYLN